MQNAKSMYFEDFPILYPLKTPSVFKWEQWTEMG